MGLDWPELKLDSSSSGFVPKTISEILADLSMINDNSVKVMKLTSYVHHMQEELRKIDAFKRELPFCALILNEALEKLKEEREQCKKKLVVGSIMTEFLPLKGSSDEEPGAERSIEHADKKNWMNSAQIWNTGDRTEKQPIKEQNFLFTMESRNQKESDGYEFESPFEASFLQRSNPSNWGGSFLAFSGQPLPSYGPSMYAPVPHSFDLDPKLKLNSHASIRMKSPEGESSKKQRRCWSPELHGLFVEALEQLGGAYKATPKQIKERMNIEGLTADEIKSHLQKYRLHLHKVSPRTPSLTAAARPSPSASGSASGTQSYMKGSCNTQGSPDGPFQMGESS